MLFTLFLGDCFVAHRNQTVPASRYIVAVLVDHRTDGTWVLDNVSRFFQEEEKINTTGGGEETGVAYVHSSFSISEQNNHRGFSGCFSYCISVLFLFSFLVSFVVLERKSHSLICWFKECYLEFVAFTKL